MSDIDFHQLGDYIIHQISIDCVIFGFHEEQIKVLLLKVDEKNVWILPGGFILQNQDICDAVNHVLKTRTGLEDIYLRQFGVFGKKDRHFNEVEDEHFRKFGIEMGPDHWLRKRFISIGYFALLDYSKVETQKDKFSLECTWVDVNDLPNLVMDHKDIVEEGFEAMKNAFIKEYIGFKLLPPEFTMAEVQSLYETVLQEKFIRSNFQRKILGLNILDRLDKRMEGKPHKAPYLYKLKDDWESVRTF
ncbi:MAG: NUDIX hydrolase [Saprospiraceae bacterium]|nr:NUDIX hydrolase [Saprospiraceae bacterium]